MFKKVVIGIFVVLFTVLMMYAVGGFIVNLSNITNENIVKFFSLIKADDILNSAIGAFLGFGASILVETIFLSRRKKKSIVNVIAELESILDGLKQELYVIFFKDENIKVTDWNEVSKKIISLAHVIYLPIWNTILQTGDVLEFKNEKYFDELIWLYTKLNKLQIMIDDYGDVYNKEKSENILNLYHEIYKALNLKTDDHYCEQLKKTFANL